MVPWKEIWPCAQPSSCQLEGKIPDLRRSYLFSHIYISFARWSLVGPSSCVVVLENSRDAKQKRDFYEAP